MRICIDPGHGQHDPGAVGPGGTREKDIVLPIALQLGEHLKRHNLDIVYTRTDDKPGFPLDLNQNLAHRARIANSLEADFFISIHCNSAVNRQATGIETFIVGRGGQAEKLADKVQLELVKALGLPNRSVKVANFQVLRDTKMPAILVELGFISNPTEEIFIKSSEFVTNASAAIAKGVCDHLGIQYKEATTNVRTVKVIAGNKEYSGILLGGKTHVHVRVLEEFGLPVFWDGDTKTVYVGERPQPKLPKHEDCGTYDVITARPDQLRVALIKGPLTQDGINGGYLDGSLNPLGITIVDDKIISDRVVHRPPRTVLTLNGDNVDMLYGVKNAKDVVAKYALGAGPSLLQMTGLDEGFQDDITKSTRERSAVGITGDGLVKLVATGPMTLTQLSQVMISQKCIHAMNLDGGGSSHLRWQGKTIRGGGRAISTAIILT